MTLTKNLGEGISKWAADTTSLEIKTYTSTDLTNIEFDNKTGKFTGSNQPRPRAMTFIKWDGDITAVIPEGDQELWEIHSELVRQAQANRAAIVEAVLTALSSLIPGTG